MTRCPPVARSFGAASISCFLLAAPLGLLACGESSPGVGDDTAVDLPFCYVEADANTYYVDAGGGAGASGKVYGLMLTDKSEDLHDPNFVAYMEYTLKNLDSGGSQLIGETTSEGDFVETLGAGNWRIQVADQRMGYVCNNTYEFKVEAGDTTFLCLDLGCK